MAPPRTVGSWAMTTHSTPETTPMPVTMLAPTVELRCPTRPAATARGTARPRSSEQLDPLPGEQLAPRAVAGDVALAAAGAAPPPAGPRGSPAARAWRHGWRGRLDRRCRPPTRSPSPGLTRPAPRSLPPVAHYRSGPVPGYGRVVEFRAEEEHDDIRGGGAPRLRRLPDAVLASVRRGPRVPVGLLRRAWPTAAGSASPSPRSTAAAAAGITEASIVLEEVAASGAAMNGCSRRPPVDLRHEPGGQARLARS